MAKDGFIDLGKDPSNDLAPKPSDGPFYPSVHVSGIDAELSAGDEVLLRCKIKRCTEEDDGTYSCDLEATALKPSGSAKTTKQDAGDGLDNALSKIEKDKISQEASDEGESEEEETSEKEAPGGDTDD